MRTMAGYLEDSRYALDQLFPLAWHEHDSVSMYEKEFAQLSRFVAEVEADPAHPYRDDHLAMSHMGAWARMNQAESDLSQLHWRLAFRRFSSALVAGSILQIAKQGISLIHKGRVSAPAGRLVGTQSLRDIIWYARNHAMHWDENKPFFELRQCFQTLSADFGAHFLEFDQRNVSFEVISLLGWRLADDFDRDMMLMA